MKKLDLLLTEIRACRHCAHNLPHKPRPVLAAHADSKILIIGQAPGRRVHQSGVPWSDASGQRLRSWLGVDEKSFYNPRHFAIVPIGFCYPGSHAGGSGKSGDLPPRPECGPLWHEKLLSLLSRVELKLLVGQYAQTHYLENKRKTSLTETVATWKEYVPEFIPLPHPSPRNNIWMRNNPWFEDDVIPYLQAKVRELL